MATGYRFYQEQCMMLFDSFVFSFVNLCQQLVKNTVAQFYRMATLDVFLTVGAVSVVTGDNPRFQQMIVGMDTPKKLIMLDDGYKIPFEASLPAAPLYITILNNTPGTNADFVIEFQSPSLAGPFGLGAAGFGM